MKNMSILKNQYYLLMSIYIFTKMTEIYKYFNCIKHK